MVNQKKDNRSAFDFDWNTPMYPDAQDAFDTIRWNIDNSVAAKISLALAKLGLMESHGAVLTFDDDE